MNIDEQTLKIITKETIETIDTMSIVTPSVYTNIFNQKAKQHSIDISDEIKLSQEILDIECRDLIQMRESNSENAIKLSASTAKAIDAIKQKDDKTLNVVLEETEKLKREIESLKEIAFRDELTGAHNRKWLRDNFLNEKNDDFSRDGSIVIVDINEFKFINDEYGHAVGDKVLIFIANNLKKTKGDVIRYGGDEFLILFNNQIELKDVVSRISKVNDYVTHKTLKSKKGEFRVSFSIGISQFKKGNNFSNILEDADRKMYANKEEIKRLNLD